MKASFDDIAKDFDNLFENIDKLSYLEALTIDRILKQRRSSEVLDCACGTGIQAIGLAEKGYRVFASDISEKILRVAKRKTKEKGLEIHFKRLDFRKLNLWGKRFDAVINCGNSITLLSNKDEAKKALSSMVNVTKKGGVGVIGIHNYLKPKRENQNIFVRRINRQTKELIFDIRYFNKARTKIDYVFVRVAKNRLKLKKYRKSYLNISADEFKRLMIGCGYKKVSLLDISGTKKFNDDEWFIAVGKV